MIEMVHELGNWMVSWAGTPYGTLALSAFAFAESSFFPIPPDILLIALCLLNPAGSLFYAAVCTLASVTGGAFGYLIGQVGGRPLLQRMFSIGKIDFVRDWYHRYDVWAVAIAGFTPIPYKVFTIAAGTFLLDFKRFMAASFLGRGGRFFLVGLMLYFFGEPIARLIENYFNLFSILFILMLALGFLVIHYWSKKGLKASSSS